MALLLVERLSSFSMLPEFTSWGTTRSPSLLKGLVPLSELDDKRISITSSHMELECAGEKSYGVQGGCVGTPVASTLSVVRCDIPRKDNLVQGRISPGMQLRRKNILGGKKFWGTGKKNLGERVSRRRENF